MANVISVDAPWRCTASSERKRQRYAEAIDCW